MSDWKAKLEVLNKELLAKDREESAKRAATLAAFRKLLSQLEPVLKNVTEFGDAFGVDCAWEISRFDDRYPWLKFRILKPALTYEVICRDGALTETIREGVGAPKSEAVAIEALHPRRFEERVTRWVQAAAQANRKVPGGGSGGGRR
ncbi:MAG TPA: hypothetical protein VD969_28850 [Symbiobacteriaceae bacterium]|nr:hypothetical protein [Symbiobacteriaceae bacterium]